MIRWAATDEGQGWVLTVLLLSVVVPVAAVSLRRSRSARRPPP